MIEAAHSADVISVYFNAGSYGLSWKGSIKSPRIGSLGRRPGPRSPPLRLVISDLIKPFHVYKATPEMYDVSIRHYAVFKMAIVDPEDREPLKMANEIKIYTHLNTKGVVDCIPNVLGVFNLRLQTTSCHLTTYQVLVTRNAGVSLAERKESGQASYVIFMPLSWFTKN